MLLYAILNCKNVSIYVVCRIQHLGYLLSFTNYFLFIPILNRFFKYQVLFSLFLILNIKNNSEYKFFIDLFTYFFLMFANYNGYVLGPVNVASMGMASGIIAFVCLGKGEGRAT